MNKIFKIDSKMKLIGIVSLMLCVVLINIFCLVFKNSHILYTIFALISSIELLIFLFINTKLNKNFINFANIFIICMYLFNFGQVILMGFFSGAIKDLIIVLKYFDTSKLFYGLQIINFLIVIIYIFILFATKNIDELKKEKVQKKDKSLLKKRALWIIGLTFPIKFIIDFIMLYVGLTKGFSASKTFLLSIPDFIVTIGNFSIIGFYLLLISLKDETKKQTSLYIFIILYIILIMLTGRRSENVAYICIFTYIYLSNKKLNLKKWILLGLIGFLGLTFLHAVVYNRNYSIGIISSFIRVLINRNIFFEVLREYGNTVYTSLIVVVEWLVKNSPSYGKSYFLGLSAIFPNLFGIMGKLTTSSNYGIAMQKSGILYEQYTNIGGSLIGEILFNFGVPLAIIGAAIIGYVIGKISNKSHKLITQTFDYKMIYYFTVMAGILYWIRDYFSGIIREIVWGLLFCWFISKIILKKEAKK